MIRKVVLPAAGHGTRLRPLTRYIPKEMLPVGDRLVLHHVLAECRTAGFDCLLAVVSRAKSALVEAMETLTAEEAGEGLYPQVYYVYQRVQGGLGHAVMHAEAFAGGDAIAVALADTIILGEGNGGTSEGGNEGTKERGNEGTRERGNEGTTPGPVVHSFTPSLLHSFTPSLVPLLARLAQVHEARGAVATIAIEEVPRERLSRYGVVRPAEGADVSAVFPIVDVVEKPAPEAAPSNLAISARYVFSPEIFPALRATTRGAGGEYQLTDAIAALARAGETVLGVRLGPGERRLDIGNHDSYREAWRLLAKQTPGEETEERVKE